MPSPPWRRVWRKSFETRLPYLDRVRGVALPRYSPAFSLRRLMYQAPETDRARHLAFGAVLAVCLRMLGKKRKRFNIW